MTQSMRNRLLIAAAGGQVFLAAILNFSVGVRYPLFQPEVFLFIVPATIIGFAFFLIALLPGRRTALIILGATIGLAIAVFARNESYLAVACWVVALAALGALLWEHFATIANVGLAVFIVSVILRSNPLTEAAFLDQEMDLAAVEYDHSLPILVHLVLDEHAGIDGIPTDIAGGSELRADLQQFYLSNGFDLYPSAQAIAATSHLSLAWLHNYQTPSDGVERLIVERSGAQGWQLTKSQYFARLAELGYRLHIRQSSYIDFCNTADIQPVSCVSYLIAHFGHIALSNLPVAEKARLLVDNAFKSQPISQTFRADLVSRLPGLASPGGVLAPSRHVTTISAIRAVNDLNIDLKSAPRGSAWFAHLLIPHFPYSFDRHCQLEPDISEWYANFLLDPLSKKNTAGSREMAYVRYFEQVRCSMLAVDMLLQTLKSAGHDDAVVVVHGDHGSRIALYDPYMNNGQYMTPAMMNDHFSTLYAIRRGAATDGRLISGRTTLNSLTATITNDQTPPEPNGYLLINLSSE